VERGLVSRTPSTTDKRRIEIEVTDSGRALLADAPVTVSMQLVDSLQRMNHDDRDTLADLLERWLRDANVDFATSPMLGEDEDAVRV
jgi:DNA-binding MarR family transcriptional regulator